MGTAEIHAVPTPVTCGDALAGAHRAPRSQSVRPLAKGDTASGWSIGAGWGESLTSGSARAEGCNPPPLLHPSSTAGARRRHGLCWRPSGVVWRTAVWSFIPRRPGSSTARTTTGRVSMNTSRSTSSATPSNRDGRRTGGGATSSASCRRSAPRPRRRSGRPSAAGGWRPPGTTSAWRIWLALRTLDLARAALAPWPRSSRARTSWSSWSPTGCPGPGGSVWGPGTTPHAARMAGFARAAGLGAVLTNAVRYADRRDAPAVDVLDAARRLVALDRRHVDRGNAEGFLKSGKQMAEVRRGDRPAGRARRRSDREARRLLAHTRAVADRCALDPRADLGLGEVHFPEFELGQPAATGAASTPAHRGATALLRARCEAGDRPPLRQRPAPADLEAARRRAGDDPRPGLRVVLPDRRRRHRPDPRDGGARARRAGRAPAAWSTTCSASPGSTRSATAC